MPNFCCTFAATSLKLLPKPADEIVPISSAQFVSPEMTQIVSTSLTQNDSSQIVPLKMAQLPSLLMHTGWTNHQPNNVIVFYEELQSQHHFRGDIQFETHRASEGKGWLGLAMHNLTHSWRTDAQ